MKTLTTGGSGQIGSAVVRQLLRQLEPKHLAISTRDPAKARRQLRARIDVRRGDCDDASSLDRAFRGVHRLLLISTDADSDTRLRRHVSAVAAAARSGVGFIAYTSLANAPANPLALARVHRETEAAITASGIPYSFLRNNWYIENEAATIQAAAAGAPVVTAAGDGRIGWASRRDLAKAAAAVLTETGHEHTVYELSGPPHTYDDLAHTIQKVVGHEVPVRQVNDSEYEEMLAKLGLPRFAMDLLIDFQRAARHGAFALESDDLDWLLRRLATSLRASVSRIIGDAAGS